MSTGNGPINTAPVFASDEDVLARCPDDFAVLCPPSQQLAAGSDGYFSPNAPWILNSASVNFQTNGVAAQHVVWLTKPQSLFKGSGIFLAVDSVSGNSVTLRRTMQPLYAGQPPVPMEGITSVEFTINTFYPQLEEASYTIKERFMLDEMIAWRASFWIYRGVEDPYRVLRRTCVLQVLADRYMSANRTDRGDFEKKLTLIDKQLKETLARVQIKFGPYGNSSEPAQASFGLKISR